MNVLLINVHITMNNLAFLLTIGSEEVNQDVGRAVSLYERAIDECCSYISMNYLALFLTNGSEDVKQDVGRPVSLYERTIAEGRSYDAMNNLALLFGKRKRRSGIGCCTRSISV